jgi:hypothetical protein
VDRACGASISASLVVEAKKDLPTTDHSPVSRTIAAFHVTKKAVANSVRTNMARNPGRNGLIVDRVDSIAARWSAHVRRPAARNLKDGNPAPNRSQEIPLATARSRSAHRPRLRPLAQSNPLPVRRQPPSRNRQKLRSHCHPSQPMTAGLWPTSRM